MSDWIQLKTYKLSRWTTETIQGAEVKVFPSPYDIPRAVRGFYDSDTKRVVVEFSYLTADEPMQTIPKDDDTVMIVGKNSGRLYRAETESSRILARNPKLGESALSYIAEETPRILASELNKAIDALASDPRHSQRTSNYEAAKEVISENEAKLFEKVPA